MSRLDPQTWSAGERAQQAAHLARVTSAIGQAVLEFCRSIGANGEFHAKQLHDYVGSHVAPASADRILRQMRSAGRVNYAVVNRRASLYRITAVAP